MEQEKDPLVAGSGTDISKSNSTNKEQWHKRIEDIAITEPDPNGAYYNLPQLKGLVQELLDAYAEENNQFYYDRGYLDARKEYI